MRRNVNPRSDARAAWAFLAPFLALVLVFQVFVLLYGIRASVIDRSSGEDEFVGLANFRALLWEKPFESEQFWGALGTSLRYTAGCLVTHVPLALLLALALNRVPFLRIRSALRAAFLVPVLVNSVTAAFLFSMYFQPQGLVNHTLAAVGLGEGRDWLRESRMAVPIMVLVSLWRSIGLQTLILMAGLQTIDPTLIEAARLDGARSWHVVRHITLPLLRPAITFAAVTTGISALQMFDLSFVLFPVQYGPGGAGKTIVAYIYDLAFGSRFLFGPAAAAGWLSFFVVMAVSLLQIRVLGLGRQED